MNEPLVDMVLTSKKQVDARESHVKPKDYIHLLPTDVLDGQVIRTKASIEAKLAKKKGANSDFYDMNHARRGVALIFNHIHLGDFPTMGAEKDSEQLAYVLKQFGFEVRVYIDPNIHIILPVLQSTAREDHVDADCLVVCVMSHGESGYLGTDVGMYPVDILWDSFNDSRCPSLIGKPKLFFIQGYLGLEGDSMVSPMGMDCFGSCNMPNSPDVMIAFATVGGAYAMRNSGTGSSFVQALCKELDEHWQTKDLLTMMTSVIRRVTTDYIAETRDRRLFEKNQIPFIISLLTRRVRLTKKAENSTSSDEKFE